MADRIVVLKGGVIQQVGTPQEVYNTPANQFVAGFIGSPSMNFLNAGIDGDALRLPDGSRLPLPADRLAAVQRAGVRSVVLGVRPEHLQPQAADLPGLGVTVSVVEPLGSDTLVYFELDGQRHVARVAPQLDPHAGERITLGIHLAGAHLFHPEDGSALR